MKKTLLAIAILILIPAITYAVKASKSSGSSKGEGGQMTVEVRQVVIKSSPNYMAKTAGTLTYAAPVNVVGEQENWYQIESPAGWVPKSALTKHKVAVNPDQKIAAKSVSHDEVALAGKGFNPQVEAQYKKENADLRAAYAAVDRIEKFGATDAELNQFQRSGKLKGGNL